MNFKRSCGSAANPPGVSGLKHRADDGRVPSAAFFSLFHFSVMQKHNHFGGFKMFFFEVTSGIVVINHISAVSGV